MARFLYSNESFTFRKYDQFFLALFWSLGLGFGGLVFRYAGSNLVSLMPLATIRQPSISGLLFVSALPYLFSAFAVFICVPRLLFAVSFVKALLLAYVSCCVFSAFGRSGWLIRWMLLFTDLIGTVLLYLYWMRHISGVRGFSLWRFAGYIFTLFLTVWLDCTCISPFLRSSLL